MKDIPIENSFRDSSTASYRLHQVFYGGLFPGEQATNVGQRKVFIPEKRERPESTFPREKKEASSVKRREKI